MEKEEYIENSYEDYSYEFNDYRNFEEESGVDLSEEMIDAIYDSEKYVKYIKNYVKSFEEEYYKYVSECKKNRIDFVNKTKYLFDRIREDLSNNIEYLNAISFCLKSMGNCFKRAINLSNDKTKYYKFVKNENIENSGKIPFYWRCLYKLRHRLSHQFLLPSLINENLNNKENNNIAHYFASICIKIDGVANYIETFSKEKYVRIESHEKYDAFHDMTSLSKTIDNNYSIKEKESLKGERLLHIILSCISAIKDTIKKIELNERNIYSMNLKEHYSIMNHLEKIVMLTNPNKVPYSVNIRNILSYEDNLSLEALRLDRNNITHNKIEMNIEDLKTHLNFISNLYETLSSILNDLNNKELNQNSNNRESFFYHKNNEENRNNQNYNNKNNNRQFQ